MRSAAPLELLGATRIGFGPKTAPKFITEAPPTGIAITISSGSHTHPAIPTTAFIEGAYHLQGIQHASIPLSHAGSVSSRKGLTGSRARGRRLKR